MRLHEQALSPALFRKLRRSVGRVGRERLRDTYQTTFWFDLGEPSNIAEEAILALKPLVPPVLGAEWWLSRMRATDVRVDFHRDRDERLALGSGKEVHPAWSSVLFLNHVRGGALAVTSEPPCEDNPARAPSRIDFDLAAPKPNRFVVFAGDLTHGVLDADNQIPLGRRFGPARMRLALIINWWQRRPTDVPRFAQTGFYRSLAVPQRPRRVLQSARP